MIVKKIYKQLDQEQRYQIGNHIKNGQNKLIIKGELDSKASKTHSNLFNLEMP